MPRKDVTVLQVAFWTIALVVALTCMGYRAEAQAIQWKPSPLGCDVTKRAFDNPFSDTKGYWQPRIMWHAEYGLGTWALGYGLYKATKMPPWLATSIATIGIGFVPHIRGYVKGQYAINISDWTFDGWNRAAPTFWAIAHRDDANGIVWKNHVVATATYLVGYAALMCFASP